jgi:hypothetical protein
MTIIRLRRAYFRSTFTHPQYLHALPVFLLIGILHCHSLSSLFDVVPINNQTFPVNEE